MPLTDKEVHIKSIAEIFATSIFNDESREGKCLETCYPLSILLEKNGFTNSIVMGYYKVIENVHYWLILEDNETIVDPTIGQFGTNKSEVFVGKDKDIDADYKGSIEGKGFILDEQSLSWSMDIIKKPFVESISEAAKLMPLRLDYDKKANLNIILKAALIVEEEIGLMSSQKKVEPPKKSKAYFDHIYEILTEDKNIELIECLKEILPERFDVLLAKAKMIKLINLLKRNGVYFEEGLSDIEIEAIEEKFSIQFPPDLRSLLQIQLPLSDGFVNWRQGLKDETIADNITSRINWPLDGILFDIKQNNYWADIWGKKPDTYEEQALIAQQFYYTYPKLIPIFSHRYISSVPYETANPIFSVHQMDIIYYGFDLATYFANEFDFTLTDDFELLDRPKKEIEFWSWCVENY
jgi:hypothetical protein